MKLNRVLMVNMNTAAQITETHLEALKALSPDTEFLTVSHADEIPARYGDADALFLWQRFGNEFEEWCMAAPSLKWIHMFTTGVDRIMASPMGRAPHIRISATRGIHGAPMSDHVLAFIFAFLRCFPQLMYAQQEKNWVSDQLVSRCEESLGKTVGIVGLGSIGNEIARKCSLLGMRVIGLKRTPVESPWLERCLVPEQLDELLARSDFVVICVPLTEGTRGMIGGPQFEKMKKSACLINVARGAVVDQQALERALQDGRIAGAGLDVFEEEPLPGSSRLWAMPNVIISQHTAPHSPLYMDRAMEVVRENVARYLEDKPLLNEVVKQPGDERKSVQGETP